MNASQNKAIDMVCGMDLSSAEDVIALSWQKTNFYFCGEQCLERFKANPIKFQGEPLIVLKEVWKIFLLGGAETKVLRGVNLRIWKGDFVVIIGPSGSGKSTVLNMMGLLDKPTSGQILFRGQDTSRLSDEEKARLRSQTFGFVFQQYHLIPWLTAYENVLLPLVFSGKKMAREDATRMFSDIGLVDRMHHRQFELSGGEQQRVAMLRALTNNPEVILGDEPTGNLDSATGRKILDMFIGLHKKDGKTLVIVTHDADIAAGADQIIALQDGQTMRNHKAHRKLYTE